MFVFNCAEHIDQEIEFALNWARRLTCPQGDITRTPRHPIAHLPTHEVTNMPPHMGDQNLWQDDQALRHWTKAEGGAGHVDHIAHVG